MSESQIMKSTKCCATCALWMGNRRPDNYGNIVYLETVPCNCYGKCGRRMNCANEKQATASCSDYVKWGVLK